MKIVYLDKEHSLNKVLKYQKSSNSNIKILFISLWDHYSTELVKKLKDKCNDKGITLYIVDSFEMPHSFVIFNTSKVPHLISLRGTRLYSEFHLPAIYRDLHIQ